MKLCVILWIMVLSIIAVVGWPLMLLLGALHSVWSVVPALGYLTSAAGGSMAVAAASYVPPVRRRLADWAEALLW